jgi:hypothetical protein
VQEGKKGIRTNRIWQRKKEKKRRNETGVGESFLWKEKVRNHREKKEKGEQQI